MCCREDQAQEERTSHLEVSKKSSTSDSKSKNTSKGNV